MLAPLRARLFRLRGLLPVRSGRGGRELLNCPTLLFGVAIHVRGVSGDGGAGAQVIGGVQRHFISGMEIAEYFGEGPDGAARFDGDQIGLSTANTDDVALFHVSPDGGLRNEERGLWPVHSP